MTKNQFIKSHKGKSLRLIKSTKITLLGKIYCILAVVICLQLPLVTVAQSENPTPTPPKVKAPPLPNEQEEIPEELNEAPNREDNPLLPPDLNSLIEKKISEDIWAELKGELPCIDSSEGCILQLQSRALSASPILKELDLRIEEANNRIAEAQFNNKKTINVNTFSPYLQVLLQGLFPPARANVQSVPIVNPLTFIFGSFFGDLAGQLFGKLFNWQGLITTQDATNRQIAIADLQIKVAELQRGRAEAAQKLRETVMLETLKLEEVAREFQIQQEIAKRDRARMQIIKVSYTFGEGNSEGYLGQLSAYDRQKAATWREWSRMRTQLTRVKIIVLGVEE